MNPVPERIRALVRQGHVVLSSKARRCLADDNLSLEDLDASILNGHVVKKETDETGQSHYKYVIIGPALDGRPVYSCGKIIDGIIYFIVTAHQASR